MFTVRLITRQPDEEGVEMEKEPEPQGRKRQDPKDMGSDDLVAAFGLATRLRACEVDSILDVTLKRWLLAAQKELESRKELERIREFLPVYYDPTRKTPVYGPGAPLTSQAAIERALQPTKPVRAIAAG
jgi:hypothetical protein